MAEQCLPGEMLVVAIDVGTTYSGYAWSFADDKYTIQAIREVDPIQNGHRGKCRLLFF
eukprot:m.158958 g.158958  ORF g.158958 m.158958 type:complete len:58 (+) comp38760_c0_seq1:73-246(+)